MHKVINNGGQLRDYDYMQIEAQSHRNKFDYSETVQSWKRSGQQMLFISCSEFGQVLVDLWTSPLEPKSLTLFSAEFFVSFSASKDNYYM